MRRLTWKVACPRRTDGSGSVKKTGAKCANRASLRNVKRSLQSVPAWRCNESRCRVPLAISGETVNGFCADVACASSAFFGLPMRSSERNTAWAWCPIVGRRVTSSGGDRWITALMGMVKRVVSTDFWEILSVVSNKRLLRVSSLLSQFPSRNRGSCRFKMTFYPEDYIEDGFPSRNRGSFNFKALPITLGETIAGFRFQSRNRGSFDFKKQRRIHRSISEPFKEFQSRNRGSFNFKC